MSDLSTDSKAAAQAARHHGPDIARRVLVLAPQVTARSLYAPQAELLAQQLRREGIDVTLATLYPLSYTNGHKTLLTKLRHFGADQWSSVRGLYQQVSQHGIIHIFAIPPSEFAESALHALLLAKFLGKYSVLSLTGGPVEESTNKLGGFLVPALRLANRIVVQSEYAARHLARHDLPVVVLPPVDSLASPIRKVDAVQPKILTIAASGPDSNISTLLRAYLQVKQKYPRIELSLVGPGRRLRAFAQTVPSNNGTSFIYEYHRQTLQRLWQEADLYVNPASDDDLPIGAFEALRAGLPVISADAPGISHLIRDRVNGMIFPANDSTALADRIIELVENPHLVGALSHTAGEDGRRFDWPSVRQDWLSLYPLH